MDVYTDRCCSLTDAYKRDVEVVPEIPNSALPPPQTWSVRSAAGDSDDGGDVTAGARSCSPSSDVENILDALHDTTTTYYGDFTLRRVFSLEEELVTHRCIENINSDTAREENPEATSTRADRARGEEDDGQSRRTTWTLPLVRRLRPAAIGKTLSRVVRRFNGFTQGRTGLDDDDDDDGDCSRLPGRSVVSASADAIINSSTRPVNVDEYLSVTSSPRPDIVLSISASAEKDQAATKQAALLQQTTCVDSTKYVDASFTTCDDLAEAEDDKQTQNKTSQTPSATISFSSSSPNVNEVQQRELELSGIACSRPEVESCSPSQSIDGFPQRKLLVSPPNLKPIQRSSSNRDASSRPPLQPRTSSPGGGHRRRSATPSRSSVDCLLGLAMVGVSRTSSCEVLVDDDDSRLSDIITRRSGVTRRSSFASSAADDGDSTAASETDSLAAYFDMDDLTANSLLDRLLSRLRSTPRDSPASCARRPSTQTSISSSSDEEIDHHSSADVTAQRALPLPSWTNHRHNSLLSSLDDVTSDSDFELGSSLSQLMVTSVKSPRHPISTSHNNDRLPGTTASLTDLSCCTADQLNSYRDWLQNYTYIPPRPAAVDAPTSVNREPVNSVTAGLSAPITESQPAQIQVARTSRILKY